MFEGESYVSLATFRRDGRAVETAVWFAEEAGRLWMFSESKAGKIKRLRNSPRARVAACDVRGRVHGTWRDASARVVQDPAQIAHALRLLRAKYGVMMWLADFFARLSGRYARRAYLEVTLAP
jgi:PPOX class probable F420-dependent enzyme